VARNPRTVPAPAREFLEPVLRDGTWVLERNGVRVPLPGQAMGRAVVDPARGTLYAACEVDGIWNLVAVPLAGPRGRAAFGPPRILTRTASGAWNPAPTPDGTHLYYTSLDPGGLAIRCLDLALPPLETRPGPEPRILSPRTVVPPPPEPVQLPREAGSPPSHPYDATEDPWIQVAAGATLGPSGTSVQLGASGMDLLGHLSWLILGGGGQDGGPRGVAAGLSSSAFPWRPSVLLFSEEESPSRQAFAPVAEDRARQGAEATLTYSNRGDTPFWVTPVVAAERVSPRDGAPFARADRTLLGLRGGFSVLSSRGPWGIEATPQVLAFQGSTSADGTQRWSLLRAGLALRFDTPVLPFVLAGSGGRIAASGTSGYREVFHLGGITPSLVPEALDSERIAQPALPADLASGDRFLRLRGQAGGAFHLYLEGTAVWDGGQERGPYQRVAGLEYTLRNPLGPLALDAGRRMTLEAGIHRCLDGAMANRTVATLGLVLRP
jgi:opacity protein-like surface antigen